MFIAATSVFGAQNDIFPTDYIASKPGEIATTLYFKESEASGYYQNGSKLLDDSVALSIQALRLIYTTEMFGYTTSLIGVGAYTKTLFDGPVVETLYPKTTSGMADLRLGITSWLLNDPTNMEYFVITSIISLPTGEYDASRAINIGENRYKATLSAGYVNRFMNNETGELFLELSPEIAVYGANNDALEKKIEQKPSYALTGYLRYKPIPPLGLFTGYQINRGGETIVNKAEQNDQPENTRFMLGGSLFFYGTQIIFRHARDTHIRTGFKTENETTLRMQWSFK